VDSELGYIEQVVAEGGLSDPVISTELDDLRILLAELCRGLR
jgi:hypothetical protein